MKILHTGDIHLGELVGPVVNGLNSRMLTTKSIMQDIANKAGEQEVDVIIIAGDIFDRAKLWQDEAMKELQIATDWLRELTATAPTVLLFGTPNHDNPNTFAMIKKLRIDNLHVIKNPEILMIETKSGSLQIAGVPGIEKNSYRTKFNGLSAEEENEFCTSAVKDIIHGLAVQIDKKIPSILTSHYTVIGAEYGDANHIFKANEIVIHQDALTATPFDLVCLGHIHRPQKVLEAPATFYCGSPNRISFNEENTEKGFWIHEIEAADLSNAHRVKSNFIKTAADEMLTLQLDKDQLQDWINKEIILSELQEGVPLSFKGKLVRVLYEAYECDNAIFNKADMQKEIEAHGGYLHEIIMKRQVILTDKKIVEESKTPEAALREYLNGKEMTPEEKQNIMLAAEPIIAAATANTIIGNLTGVFEPIMLTVKNYRSYREESFDFTKIRFATVNGENGIGKSAFFMDAVADCLYEETREGDIAGWINSDMEVKSGAITFEFKIGDTQWRVARTRGKKSKPSLHISEYENDEWVNRSCEKMSDTQDKIIKLIGMDSSTFKSCALIMQDKYAIFLEATKEERISVLGDLLGLDIYTELEKLVRSSIGDCNKELSKVKEKLDDLSLSGIDITALRTIESSINKSITNCDGFLIDFKSTAENLNREKAAYEKCNAEVFKLSNDIGELNLQLSSKKAKKAELQTKIERAQKVIDNEIQILEKATYFECQKTKIVELKAKLEDEADIGKKIITLENDLTGHQNRLKNIQTKIESGNADISKYEAFREKAVLYEAEHDKLIRLQADKEIVTTNENEIVILTSKARELTTSYELKIQKAKMDLAAYIKKAEILRNSNCIDIDSAQCLFLKDAVEANKAIAETENSIRGLEEKKNTDEKIMTIENRKKELRVVIDELIFNADTLAEQEKLVSSLLEAKNKAALLDSLYLSVKEYEVQQSDTLSFIEKINKEVIQLNEKKEAFKDLRVQLQAAINETEGAEAKKWFNAKELLPASKEIVLSSGQIIIDIDIDIENLNKQIADKALEKFDKENSPAFNWPAEDKKQKDLAYAKIKIVEYENAKNNFLVELGSVSEKIKSALENQRRWDVLIKEQREIMIKKLNFNKLLEAFSQDGIPFNIIRTVVPEIQGTANTILSQMTGGKMSLSMKTDKMLKSNKKEVNCLEIMITDLKHGTLPYLSKSGGQRVKAALAVAFALAEIKSTRAGIQLGMLFIDEPPFLDEQGTQAYCDALETISQRYSGMRVIAITHDRAMKARFPQSIDVVSTDEGSKILFL